ncbi:MAG: hypothetical protein JNK49_15865 [Planctomycetes bacterium]|nr:hypothetical protein [Planctomycetota bacterium]
MQFDSQRSRVVLFGGIDNGTYLNDTWEWDGVSWMPRNPTSSPSPRDYHAMAYDSARAVMACYGGWNGSTVFNETWEWNGVTWALRTLAATAYRLQNHGMAYDRSRSQFVVYGGWNNLTGATGGYRGETWEWDGGPQGWVLRSPAVRPPARRGHVMVYDEARGRTVVCGGHLSGQVLNADTWEWDGNSWSQRTPLVSPPAHVVASSAYDSIRREVVAVGMGSTNDTWRLVPSVPAEVMSRGQGCAGSVGMPVLSSSSRNWPVSLPWGGKSCVLEMSNLGPNPPNIPFVALGFSNTAWNGLPLPMSLAQFGLPNCTLYVAVDVLVALANNGGRADWAFVAPGSSAFLGFQMYAQGLVLDASHVPPRVATSNYCELIVGGL